MNSIRESNCLPVLNRLAVEAAPAKRHALADRLRGLSLSSVSLRPHLGG